MNSRIFSKEISSILNYDVAVLGGGPGGFMAAVAAAREGAKTVLIEQNGYLGGMATAGMVAPISVFRYNNQLKVGGLAWEFVQRMEQEGAAKIEYPLGNVSFAPEQYKLIAQRMVQEAGVVQLLHTTLIGCEQDHGRITRVIAACKQGLLAIEADVFIDSTGDADLAAYAGVPMQERDWPLQPCSTYFCIGGVDITRVPKIHHSQQGINYHIEEYRDILLQHMEEDQLPEFGGPWMCYMMNDNSLLVNTTRRSVDILQVEEASKTECQLREDAFKLAEAFKKYIPGFENSYILFTAPTMGVRESRHIKGVHVLTPQEYLDTVKFPDAVTRSSHPIDIHAPEGHSQKCEFLKEAAYIPYRSLIAEGFPNLIVACRSYSASREAFASSRVQAPVMGIGQAAGIAAALCVKGGTNVQDIDIDLLRQKLIETGAQIE